MKKPCLEGGGKALSRVVPPTQKKCQQLGADFGKFTQADWVWSTSPVLGEINRGFLSEAVSLEVVYVNKIETKN